MCAFRFFGARERERERERESFFGLELCARSRSFEEAIDDEARWIARRLRATREDEDGFARRVEDSLVQAVKTIISYFNFQALEAPFVRDYRRDYWIKHTKSPRVTLT